MDRYIGADFSKLVDFIHDCVELGNDDNESDRSVTGD